MPLSYRRESRTDYARLFERARAAYHDGEWLDVATGRLTAPPVAPEQGVDWLARQCVELVTDEWDATFGITGKEGVSKSTLALQFAVLVGKKSGVPWTFDNLCYSAREVLNAYERAVRGSVIWLDEGARGLWAGDTFDPEQKALEKSLTLVRETGAILVVCSPSIWLLTKKFRGRRMAFWAHVESRGTRRDAAASRAKLHERDDRLHYTPSDALGLYGSLRCPTLTYEPFALDDPIYLEYRRIKKQKLQEFYDETNAELDVAQTRRLGRRRPKTNSLNRPRPSAEMEPSA